MIKLLQVPSVARQRIIAIDRKRNLHRHHSKAKFVRASSNSTPRVQRSTTRRTSSGGGTFVTTAGLAVRLSPRPDHPSPPQAMEKTKEGDSDPSYGLSDLQIAYFGIARRFLERHKRCFPLLMAAVDPSISEG
ncbi:hypothetical protein CNYM01_10909 [Colletotrichum nymphaeae SA-01]|uniref:Uncharacterized protein n=1 Tax=Colletotrichum nymphaeae SA-01 TaxID=1460502 RepID=A0A135TGB5_9PEZI|nr:hypothetical protein CNYM01_10909 [Colletotrichum nymphaeae SA-01]